MKAHSSSTCTIFHIKMKLQNMKISTFLYICIYFRSVVNDIMYVTLLKRDSCAWALSALLHIYIYTQTPHTSSSIPESPKIISSTALCITTSSSFPLTLCLLLQRKMSISFKWIFSSKLINEQLIFRGISSLFYFQVRKSTNAHVFGVCVCLCMCEYVCCGTKHFNQLKRKFHSHTSSEKILREFIPWNWCTLIIIVIVISDRREWLMGLKVDQNPHKITWGQDWKFCFLLNLIAHFDKLQLLFD